MDFLNDHAAFDFESGDLSLDFANTADWSASPEPVEGLNRYEDLLAWGLQAGVLDGPQAQVLLARARTRPQQARATVQQAVRLREAIFRIFSQAAGEEPALPDDLGVLNQALQQALPHLRVGPDGEAFAYRWEAGSPELDRVLWPVARAAAELLTSERLERVGRCADDRGCGYLFYDTSRNHSRRWCSMESCGNRAKAMRHYERRTAGDDPSV